MRMNGKPVTQEEAEKILLLRRTGHSLPEIRRATKRGSSTVWNLIKDIEVPAEFVPMLRMKQGGSRKRSDLAWAEARLEAKRLLAAPLSSRERLLLLAGLYWGEGTKASFNVINSDPAMIKTAVECMRDLGIQKKDLRISLRLHSDIRPKEAVAFWAELLGVDAHEIKANEIIPGKKIGKLRYGMCRVRVAKAERYFKLVMSLIHEVQLMFDAAVVQRIERGTPKP